MLSKDRLDALRDASLCCNHVVVEALATLAHPPLRSYTSEEWDRWPPKAEIKPYLPEAWDAAAEALDAAGLAWDAADLKREAINLIESVLGMRARPVIVDGRSCMTAHEAARVAVEALAVVLRGTNRLDGDNRERARRLAGRLRKRFPAAADLEGQIVAEYNEIVALLARPAALAGGAPERLRASAEALFPKGAPRNSDLVDLAILLQAERAKPEAERRADIEIAREFKGDTAGDDTKSRSLLEALRRMRRKGQANF